MPRPSRRELDDIRDLRSRIHTVLSSSFPTGSSRDQHIAEAGHFRKQLLRAPYEDVRVPYEDARAPYEDARAYKVMRGVWEGSCANKQQCDVKLCNNKSIRGDLDNFEFLRAERATLQSDIQRLENEATRTRSEREELRAECEQLSKKCAELWQLVERDIYALKLSQDFQDAPVTEELASLSAMYQERIEERENYIKELERELNRSEEARRIHIDGQTEAGAKNSTLHREVAQLSTAYNTLEKEVAILRSKNASLVDNCKSLESKVISLQHENQKQRRESTIVLRQLQEAAQLVSATNAKITVMSSPSTAELSALQEQVASVISEHQRLVLAWNKERAVMEKMHAEIENELTRTREQRDQYKHECTELWDIVDGESGTKRASDCGSRSPSRVSPTLSPQTLAKPESASATSETTTSDTTDSNSNSATSRTSDTGSNSDSGGHDSV